jgi:CheY-like chemotaxis protein
LFVLWNSGDKELPYTSKIAQFTLSLPAPAAKADPVVHPALHVLLVEPNDYLRQCFKALLSHYKYTVACAANTCEAIASASQVAPHAVILSSDFRSPEDFALCKQLRTIPETAGSKFLGLTEHYFEDMYKLAKSAGFDRYYLKPIQLTTFMTILNSMLMGHAPHPAASSD